MFLEKTVVPLWSIFLAGPVFVGFVVWLANVAYITDTNARELTEMRSDIKALYEIKSDIRVIKHVLKIQEEKGEK